ncbi:ArsI/CadI family heavy metal resistance metalloenzyme [Cognatiluteimonas weifangensis]|uniref:Glyoxalase/bleomycin resistance/dioxygenase family protein n=1 Tax=Cognatiluteimonas weifangensis TaxID=2303539 RepID=A0A372DT21_9GAMM|nr:ArsI/CadI family heavy metal resistance metalloenzyme [Luteimonas weifangensis]RFP62502.1 glyoxalase/bleomycin resistance/dioxygenase family protein [Luteimonas weifangensis]
MTAQHRFHVHVHVADLDASLRFYTRLFGTDPSVQQPDYAKWMLEDPRLNFAISSGKAGAPGIAHLGLQADTPEALAAIGARLQAADAVVLAETGTTCCYARSDKFWAQDPQGVRWEAFHSHGAATSYYAPAAEAPATTCCGPDAVCAAPATADQACCDRPATASQDTCCGATSASQDACCGSAATCC